MTISPCQCGKTPELHAWKSGYVYHAQIKCPCGKSTAMLSYTRPENAGEMQRVAVEAWKLGC